VDFSLLLSDLADAKADIAGAVATSVLDLDAAGGVIEPDTFGSISGSGLSLSSSGRTAPRTGRTSASATRS
jgi:hypothetical protein